MLFKRERFIQLRMANFTPILSLLFLFFGGRKEPNRKLSFEQETTVAVLYKTYEETECLPFMLQCFKSQYVSNIDIEPAFCLGNLNQMHRSGMQKEAYLMFLVNDLSSLSSFDDLRQQHHQQVAKQTSMTIIQTTSPFSSIVSCSLVNSQRKCPL